MVNRTYGKISDHTRARCKIVELQTEKDRRRFANLGLEFYHYFYEIERLEFSLYFRIDDLVVEFIRPKEHSRELLEQLWKALLAPNQDADLCVLMNDYDRYFALLERVRQKKIQKLLKEQSHLDQRIITIFENITRASQLVARGGIDQTTVQAVEQSARYLVDNVIDSDTAISTLSRMITCDATLYDHSASVAMFASVISQRVSQNFSKKEKELIAQCGLYHDAGKTCIPAAILNKPGRFTAEEYEVMKTHAERGQVELLRAIEGGANIDRLAARVAGEHHENFDGTGYPCGHKGRFEDDEMNGIHIYSRIVTVADVYSALLMKRVYKEAMEPQQALKIMIDCAHKFDPDVFNAFLKEVASSLNCLHAKEHGGKGRILAFDDEGSMEILDKSGKAI